VGVMRVGWIKDLGYLVKFLIIIIEKIEYRCSIKNKNKEFIKYII
jgi:hypothetical protein